LGIAEVDDAELKMILDAVKKSNTVEKLVSRHGALGVSASLDLAAILSCTLRFTRCIVSI
jgi:hypothetical protein